MTHSPSQTLFWLSTHCRLHIEPKVWDVQKITHILTIEFVRCLTEFTDCLVPRRLSFDKNVRAKEGGKETTGFACLPYPSHGPLRFITSHSFCACLYHAKNEVPEEEAGSQILYRLVH